MIIHMRHTLWTGISETNVNVITSAMRTHAFNNNNNNINKHIASTVRFYITYTHYCGQHVTSCKIIWNGLSTTASSRTYGAQYVLIRLTLTNAEQ